MLSYMGSDTQADAYADYSMLVNFLGGSPQLKILSGMLSEDSERDLSISQIADLAGVHRTTVYSHLEDLEERDVIRETRTIGNSQMYEMNYGSAIVQKLEELEETLLYPQPTANEHDDNRANTDHLYNPQTRNTQSPASKYRGSLLAEAARAY